MDLKLDPLTHDLLISSGDLVATTPLEQIAQSIWLRLKTQRASYAFDVDMGIPWIEFAQMKGVPLQEIEAIARAEIMAVVGVTGISSVELEYDSTTRELSGRFAVETDAGLVTVAV
jgi:hypothetical protein